MTDRIPLDAMTSDQLDALYDERDQLRAELAHQEQETATWRATANTLDAGGPGTPRDRAERAEAAVARVRTLHTDEYGLCAACTSSHGVLWPCDTIRALDGEEQP